MSEPQDISQIDLEGKTVRLKAEFFKLGHRPEEHLFVCQEGFGCKPYLMGRKIFGVWQHDGQSGMITRDMIDAVIDEPSPETPTPV